MLGFILKYHEFWEKVKLIDNNYHSSHVINHPASNAHNCMVEGPAEIWLWSVQRLEVTCEYCHCCLSGLVSAVHINEGVYCVS